MSNEMEIMKWFDSKWYGPNEPLSITYPTPGALRDAIREQLPDAVKRENDRAICNAFEEMLKGDNDNSIYNARFIREYVRKRYSPAPQYCEGMQEAIDRGSVEKINGLWWMKSAFWREDKKIFDAYSMILKRCPVCKDGKNCIGGKE